MKKVILWIFASLSALLLIFLLVYPHVELMGDGRLTVFSYTDRFSEFDENNTLDENYCYNEKRDISIHSFEEHRFLFFRVLIMEYVEGDMRQKQFLLEESYIADFLQNAIIEENECGLELAQLLEGREAVVGNTRYFGNDYKQAIHYTLSGDEQVLYIFYVDDLLVIQVGYTDESPKFIAYRTP